MRFDLDILVRFELPAVFVDCTHGSRIERLIGFDFDIEADFDANPFLVCKGGYYSINDV